MRHVRAIRLAALTLGVAIGGATGVNGGGPGADGPIAEASTAGRCAALQGAHGWPSVSAVLASAVLNPNAPAAPATGPFSMPTPALPEHCEVVGKLGEREGANGQRYAIGFRLRLPTSWNGRFFFQGGGGSNGAVGNALGALQGQQPAVALALGYAVVSQDSGHDNMLNNDPARGGTQTFGFDSQARLDFGYHSYDEVTRTAKAIVVRYYGKGPQKSYFVGCSEGGREGMMLSQRFPNHFDGILACSPGFRLPRAAVAEAWDSQAFASIARAGNLLDRNGQPFLNRTFTDEDLLIVSKAVLAACDDLDGAADGMVQRFTACTTAVVQPKLAEVTCQAEKNESCLSPAQVSALKKVFDGATTSTGEKAYARWAWDAGVSGKAGAAYNQGWRIWKLGAYGGQNNSAINMTLGASALPSIFVTPPVAVATTGGGAGAYALSFGIDGYREALGNTTDTFRQSALEFMKADSTDLTAFKNRGGKLMIAQGVSDPVFSILDTIEWWTAVNDANRGRAAQFVRLFAVPGMNHCAGGPSTDQFDAFGALVNWVEKGVAPERIVATAGVSTPWPGRTRPLCSYPKYAHFTSGDPEAEKNFECRN